MKVILGTVSVLIKVLVAAESILLEKTHVYSLTPPKNVFLKKNKTKKNVVLFHSDLKRLFHLI